jgi:hypothetical protein
MNRKLPKIHVALNLMLKIIMKDGRILRNSLSEDGSPTPSQTLAWTVMPFIQLLKYAHFGLRNRTGNLHLKCKTNVLRIVTGIAQEHRCALNRFYPL